MFSPYRVCLKALRQNTYVDITKPQSLSPVVQFVRWRKRRWAPLNRSKQFYVRKPTPIDPEEWKELKTRTGIYNTHVKAITKFFKVEMKAAEAAAVSTSVVEEEEREFQDLLLENDTWNAETAKVREARYALQHAADEKKRHEKLRKIEQHEELERKKSEELVLQELEQVKHFINVGELESEIEKALNMRVNYNFAIDLDGKQYLEQPDGSTLLNAQEHYENSQVFHVPETSKETLAETERQ